MGTGRALAGLLSIDVVESTKYLADHGIQASIQVRQQIEQEVQRAAPNARVVDRRGDGMILAFDSLREAISAGEAVLRPDLRAVVTIAELADDELAESTATELRELDQECAPGCLIIGDSASLIAQPDVGQLVAVLFSDAIASPSSLTRPLSDTCIERHGGRVVDSNGAGSVGLFSACADALAAAADLHESALSLGLRADVDHAPQFHVGVTAGEVVETADGVHGLAVNEAARLLEHAGTVSAATVTSAAVVDLADLDPAARGRSLGTLELKGLPLAVPATALDAPAGALPLLPLPHGLLRQFPFPLVGRGNELTALSNIWTSSIQGAPSTALVSGEEGIGKSRLVNEVARIAHAEGAVVLHGAADEDLDIPYSAVAQALGHVVTLDEEVAAACYDSAGSLAMLFGNTEQSPDQFALFAAVVEVFERLAAKRPVLIVIDDVQWAEPETLLLLRHIMDTVGEARVSLLTTCRTEHLTHDHQLLAMATEHVRLERLGGEDIVALLEARAVRSLSDSELELAQKIAEMSGGSPLHFEELTAHLARTGVLVQDVTGWSMGGDVHALSIPDSVVALMADRAARLGPETVNILAIAAVLGASFEVEVLTEVLDEPLGTVIDAIERAENARLIREADRPGLFDFADEVAREAVLRTLGSSRRAVVHELVATTLERCRPNQIDRLASHWSAAMGSAAREKAIHYLVRLGERDLGAAAWESAASRYALLIERLGNDPADAVAGAAHYGRGLALRKLGHPDYRPQLIRTAELARKSSDGHLLASAAVAMMRPGAWYTEAAVVDTDIVAMCEDALLLLADDDPRRPQVLAALAVNLTYGSDAASRGELVAEAQRLAREAGDLQLIGTTMAAELISFHEPDRYERRRELAEEVRKIGRAISDRDLLFVGSWFIVLDLMSLGEIDDATELVAELTELVTATREYWPSFLVAHFESAMAVARCDENALAIIEAERVRFEDHPVDSFGVSVIQSATVAMGHGTLSDMLISLFAAAEEHDVSAWSEKWNYALSKAYLDAGDTDAALEAISSNPEPAFDYYWLTSMYHIGLLGLKTGRVDLCERAVASMGPYRGRFAMVGLGACLTGQVSTSIGQAYLGLNNVEQAEIYLREAIEQADRLDFHYFATNARRYLAETLLRRDPAHPEAVELVAHVLRDADRFAFGRETQEAEQLRDQIAAATN